MMIFFIFANFSTSRKNWRFSPPRPWGPFSLISHLCPDFIQMSEFLYLSCPDVRLWWFSSFSKTRINWRFPPPRPWGPFSLISHLCPDSSKWVNFYILVVLMSDYDDFLHFRKNWRFSPPRPWGPFSLISHLCPDFIQMSEFLYLSCPENYDDFLHFRKLFHKSKKLKIFPTPALGTLFAYFTLVPRFHPNEWIFIS